MEFDPAKLKHYRVYKAGLSMEQLAKNAKLAYRTVFNVESGKTPPTISTIRKLAQTLDITIEDLMTGATGAVTNSEKIESSVASNNRIWAAEEILRHLKIYQKEVLERPHFASVNMTEHEKQQNYALLDEITWHVLRAEERLHQVKS